MRTLLLLIVCTGVGCTQLQPVGPMARLKGPPKSAPLPAVDPNPAPPGPVTVAAPRPVPPATLITVAEVTLDDPYAAAQKLTTEIENDRKTTPPAPRTAEVSVYKGGVKQD